jgi:hypothetical protein
VAGLASLDGQLVVSLDSSFAPADGDAFQLIAAGEGMTGAFDSTELPLLEDGLAWDLDYASHGLTLRVLAASFLPSDFDQDGDVDGDDFLLWQSGFPTLSGATKFDGDADEDGDVDGDDFLIWQSEFPSPGVGAAASVTAPEPAALLLLWPITVLAAARCRHRSPLCEAINSRH